MLGYADDDETEEMKVYKVLITETWEGLPLIDPYIIYTNEVVFDENRPLEPLSTEPLFSEDDDLFEQWDDQNDEYIDEPPLIDPETSDDDSNNSFVGLSQKEISGMTNLKT